MNNIVPSLNISELKKSQQLSRSPRPEDLTSDPKNKLLLSARLYTHRSSSSRPTPMVSNTEELPNSDLNSTVPHPPAAQTPNKTPRIPFGVSKSMKSKIVSKEKVFGASKNPLISSKAQANKDSNITKSVATIKVRDVLNEIPCYNPREYPIESSTIKVPNWDDIEEKEHFLDLYEGDSRYMEFRSNPNSFLYLYPISGNQFNLGIIDATDVSKEDYFTLTHTGILHCCNNESEFMPLDQYDREYHLFYKTRKIRFFRFYNVCKSFFQWKMAVAERKRVQYQQSLQKNLFILDPKLKQGIDIVTSLCSDLKTLIVFEINFFHTYTLDEFERIQNKMKNIVISKFEDFKLKVREAMKFACRESLKKHLEMSGFGGNKIYLK